MKLHKKDITLSVIGIIGLIVLLIAPIPVEKFWIFTLLYVLFITALLELR